MRIPACPRRLLLEQPARTLRGVRAHHHADRHAGSAGIALHHEGARQFRDSIGYFQAVQGNIQKYTVGASGKTDSELHAAILQIVSEAISSAGVIDVFGTAGIPNPDISVLSDELLETV
ncbi:MAG: DUF3387 domain-containing protein [Myxococcales bacterium]|nr:DUF3387 domain-containing protein [Myxococcales bacterium]